MASGTNYSQEYEQAEKAYISSNFDKAATIIDKMAQEFPKDPNVLLLRGNIYCYGFQNYDLALQQYELVLQITDQQDLLDFAHNGIDKIKELQQSPHSHASGSEELESTSMSNSELGLTDRLDELDLSSDFTGSYFGLEDLDLEAKSGNLEQDSEAAVNSTPSSSSNFNPFEQEAEDSFAEQLDDENPFTNDEYLPSRETQQAATSDRDEVQPIGTESETFLVDEEDMTAADANYFTQNNFAVDEDDDDLALDTLLTEPFKDQSAKSKSSRRETQEDWSESQQTNFDSEEIDSSFFELADIEQELPDTGLFNTSMEVSNNDIEVDSSNNNFISANSNFEPQSSSSDAASSFKNSGDALLESNFENQKGMFAKFKNAPIKKKPLIVAGAAGIITLVAVALTGVIANGLTAKDKSKVGNNPIPMAIVGGLAGFGTSLFLGKILAKELDFAARDIQNQFESVYQGNLNAKATPYSKDEIGQLAVGFNRMMRVILTTTNEAQRRAEETEQAKEDLQRQVIRLLDDVEGAARGDLTVQATVTADVLGAVADAFNLTIQSLREIVRQVKQAAEQVNKSSTASEEFARNQSSDALRMAEELAVTLNSVQMMTESIERVAENAREAEEVARTSSITALKGGQAVERTVSGIFQIRETVSETARKVKRLAEASQEISKIVLLISQIAERTNQLALNASIQAAKAGEAGRGFAVVADEVRQLADRSAKSLKEIEQIVLQIQSETGSVMTAMEEGIQEVIDVTNRAEQAKKALEDIIQVSNRIDTLVRSITADTVEQRENSRAVAQVMQSVELTAQETSQESQKVAGSLQNLVSIARNLLSSVERFRIDKNAENN
jgi:twitching motility protein PilJ